MDFTGGFDDPYGDDYGYIRIRYKKAGKYGYKIMSSGDGSFSLYSWGDDSLIKDLNETSITYDENAEVGMERKLECYQGNLTNIKFEVQIRFIE